MIHSFETERYCLSGILRFPKIFPDIASIISENDFVSRLNRTIFSAIRDIALKGDDINEFVIAEKIKNLGISFKELEQIDLLEFLEELKMCQITESAAMSFLKELKKITIRREISASAELIQKKMLSSQNESIENLISLADEIHSGAISKFYKESGREFSNIYDTMEQIVEERGNNPVDEIGYLGKFPRVNFLYGSLLRTGNITMIGSRTGVGKTSLGFDYLTDVSERYGIPVLHLDAGEMSELELQIRAVCRWTEGVVPFDHIEKGKWRKSPEMTKIVRDVWTRVKKLKYHYRNIGEMGMDEVISTIRRFYISYVGRGNEFLIHYDYLKPFDAENSDTPEWAQMGHFVKKIKSLITTEIPTSMWTSLQLNRSGIVNGKTASQIDDSENSFSISDRITQQVSHAAIMRKKVMEELQSEANKFGNSKMIFVKHRHLGEGYQEALNPVRMMDGSLKQNFIHINSSSFNFTEKGDLLESSKSNNQILHHQKAPAKDDSDLILD